MELRGAEVDLAEQRPAPGKLAGPGARLHFRYIAPRIYLVAAPPAGSPRTLSAMVDGGASRRIHVGHDDLYELAHLASPGPHLLTLSVPSGTSLYSFTFG